MLPGTRLANRTCQQDLLPGLAIAGWRYPPYDGIVALAAASVFRARPGVILMMIVLLIAGIGMLLAGLATVGLGIELDLSFGNTLIQTGAIVTCTGMMMLSLWAIVRELKNVALQLGPDVAATSPTETPRRFAAAGAPPRDPAPESDSFPFGRDQPDPASPDDAEAAAAPSGLSPAPWQEPGARARHDPRPVPPAAEAAPAVKQRRNLSFSSSPRKERERAEARTTGPLATAPRSAPPAAPPLKSSEAPPPVTSEDTWPQSERSWNADAPSQRRGGRIPSTFTEPDAGATGADRYSPAAPNKEYPPITVLKSGVVDGMAYSLYSDGSIEAQMPEGMMRFASIDELRAHLDQRP
jgi:hypothetical protein